ncbi:PepSY-associated TM helix domain-containing protein [Parashewanella tropica]|uniref:PepSY-associated TM helix domain-containing protein n=1 Tax=Parashewanella tropica TaxID=2547970 RepID=UPI0010599E61|nr:PepSY-associated TM helix domain-containing protein [Parashewanella tropica]
MKVRGDILRLYQFLHTWSGITTGMLLFIAFFAGALTMFKEPLAHWVKPMHHQSEVSIEQMQSQLDQVLNEQANAKNQIVVNLDANNNHQPHFTWYPDAKGRTLNLEQQAIYGVIDDNSQLQITYSAPTAFSELVDALHRTGGIPGTNDHGYFGVTIMGLVSIAYFLAIVSGVIVLLPTLVKSLFALRTNKGKSRFWLDSHNILGVTSLPFHIVICFTAIVFAFHDDMYDSMKAAIYGDQPMFQRAKPTQTYPLEQLKSISELKDIALSINPNAQVLDMTFRNLTKPNASVMMSVYDETQTMHGAIADHLIVHPYTGKIQFSSIKPGEGGIWKRIVATFFAAHFGSFGGPYIRWIYFALGLAGAFLFYSGNLLWLEKRKTKPTTSEPNPTQSRSWNNLAKLNIGVCLGAIAGIATCMALSKWLLLFFDNINRDYLTLYYVVFMGAVISAFVWGTYKASKGLLMYSGLLCLSIPITSVLAWLFPSMGMVAPEVLSYYWVDAVVLLFAVVFIRQARKLKQPE